MTLLALGELTVGGAVPGCVSAVAEGTAGINAALPDIQARIAALFAFTPSATIDYSAQLIAAQQIVAALQAAILAGQVAPSLSAQVDAAAALRADLLVSLGHINANLSVLAALNVALGPLGVAAYAYDGDVGDLAFELDDELGVDGDHCNALVLVVRAPDVWAAFSQIMKVS